MKMIDSRFFILHNLNDDDEQEMFEVDQDELVELLELLFEKGSED